MTGGKLALVIGAGAVKCAAALGMRQVLESEGIPVDMLVGCSSGSLYAATMALGYLVEECIEKTRRMWNREVTRKRNNRAILQAALPGVFKFDDRFSMFDALRASIAILYIWPAWQVNGETLVDGSLASPMPSDVAILHGAEIITAMGFELPKRSRMRSYSAVANHFNSLYMNNILKASFAFQNAVHHSEIIPILPDFERKLGTLEAENIAYIIEQGVKSTEEHLPYIMNLLAAYS